MGDGSLLDLLDDMIEIGFEASNWQEAVRESGRLLASKGIVEEEYIEAMIRTVKELGPYSVIAPGVAIPHARPEEGARGTGFSLVVLKNGVNFGSPNDPVYIVIAFAAKDREGHLRALKQLADLLGNESLVDELRRAGDINSVKRIIAKYLGQGYV